MEKYTSSCRKRGKNYIRMDASDAGLLNLMIVMQYLDRLFVSLQQARTWLIQQGEFFTGWTEQQLTWTLIVVGAYLLLFLIFMPLHRFLKRKKIRLQQELVAQVDEMLFLTAKAQHLANIDKKALGGDPHLALMRSIFTKGNCDYIQSATLILENINKVQQLLGQQVIAPETEASFLKGIKNYRLLSFFEGVLKVMLAIPTLGLYLLFA